MSTRFLFSLLALAPVFVTLGGCADSEVDEADSEEQADTASAIFGESEAAPACVRYIQRHDDWAFSIVRAIASNGCAYSVNVGLDIKGAVDGKCERLEPGRATEWTVHSKSKIRKLKKCE